MVLDDLISFLNVSFLKKVWFDFCLIILLTFVKLEISLENLVVRIKHKDQSTKHDCVNQTRPL